MRDRSGKREIGINEGRQRPDRERKRSVPTEGSLDVDRNAWRRVAWMMVRVVMAAVEHGGEVKWVRTQCDLGRISVVRRDLGRGGDDGGSTIWAGLGLAGRPKLGVRLCVELRLVCGLELK